MIGFRRNPVPMTKRGARLAAAALAGFLEVSGAYGAEPLVARLLQDPPRRAECAPARSLHLCVGARTAATTRRLAVGDVARRTEARYNRLQRLAGAIADRMEAGSIGGVRLKLKIILESALKNRGILRTGLPT